MRARLVLVSSLALLCCKQPAEPPVSVAKAVDAPQAKDPPKAAPRWHCPMHPSYVSDHPSDCPLCGMKLVPVEAAEKPARPTPEGFAQVKLSEQERKLLGIRSVTVKKAPLSPTIRALGRVTYDETRVHHVHTRYEAYVERLYANFTGKYVTRGEPLVSLYSPDLLAAEQEYLLALRSERGTVGKLAAAARERLLLWNISAADIAALEKNEKPSHTLNLYSPISGYVVSKTAVHGMRVKPEDSLFDIVDLSRMWVIADVYEYELPRVALGQKAEMTLSYWPNRSWSGKVSYIYPNVDVKTRTVKVRLDVANDKGDLKAEMFASVLIHVGEREALVIPEDAVVETGTRRLVFVLTQEGLTPREINRGERHGDLVEIRSGLEEGESVAAGATFLIDSESRIQAAIAKITEGSSK